MAEMLCGELSVFCFMTFLAQGFSIRDLKAKLWKIREGENVVGLEVPSSVIPAMKAPEAITKKHIKSPLFILGRETQATPNDGLTVLECVMRWPPFRLSAGSMPLAHSSSLFNGPRYSSPRARFPNLPESHQDLGFLRVRSSFEGGDSPLRGPRVIYTTAFKASSVSPGPTSRVNAKVVVGFPCTAFRTPFQTRFDPRMVVIQC